jgi:hypothetical protein
VAGAGTAGGQLAPPVEVVGGADLSQEIRDGVCNLGG